MCYSISTAIICQPKSTAPKNVELQAEKVKQNICEVAPKNHLGKKQNDVRSADDIAVKIILLMPLMRVCV